MQYHLAVFRHVVRGEWDELRGMDPHRQAADDSFCQYLFRHQVAKYTLTRLTGANQESLVPATWIETMRAPQAKAQEYANRHRAAMAQAVVTLRAAGVACRVLKGPTFAQKYYGSADLRRMVDIDLLTGREDVHRALAVLWEIGYRCKPNRVKVGSRGVTIKKRMFRQRHAMPMTREGLSLDLHWQLRNWPSYRLEENDVLADGQQVSLDGMTYDVLSDEYAMVLLALSIAEDIGRGSCRLKHLLDVHQLLSRKHAEIDWPKFFERRLTENVAGISVNVLAIMMDVFESWDDFPTLAREMERHQSLRVGGDALALVHELDGNEANRKWFTDFHRETGISGWTLGSMYHALRGGLRRIVGKT